MSLHGVAPRMTEPLTYEQIVEAMGDAIRAGRFHAEPSDQIALRALSALRALCDEGGYRLMVPKDATPDMAILGGIAWMQTDGETAVDNFHAAWGAALAAAPDPTKEPE